MRVRMRLPTLDQLSEAGVGILWALIISVVLLKCFGPEKPRPAVVETDTATAADYRTQVAAAQLELATVRGERDDLRGRLATAAARIRGLEERKPERITIYDTTFVLLDPVALRSTIDGRGSLTILGAVPVDSGMFQPRTLSGINVADCDNGIDIIGTSVICDRPRAGHLEVFVSAGASAPLHALEAPIYPVSALGVHWEPSFRSLWDVTLEASTEGRAQLTVTRGVRLW